MEFDSEKLLQTAIEEMKSNQHSEAAAHFDMVVISDPDNIDARFFRAYCKCFDIKLGEMPNAATNFTGAFCKYVDDVKRLNDPEIEKEKLDYAVTLLTTLVSMYKTNANRTMITAPTIGISISSAASNMNSKCMAKITSSGANVSSSTLEVNNSHASSNNKALLWLIIVVAIFAVLGILWFASDLFI